MILICYQFKYFKGDFMRFILLLSVLVLSFVFCGCNGMSNPEVSGNCKSFEEGSPSDFSYKSVVSSGSFSAAGMAASVENGFKPVNFTVPAGRKMVYTAFLTINVPDVQNALKTASEMTEKSGGYVQSSNDNSAILRIPMEKATETFAQIEKLGVVVSRRINTEDITEQVVDTEIRLDNLMKLRERLTALCAKAEKVEDMLKIEAELSRVTTEIERLQGQLKLAGNRVKYMTLHISFVLVLPAEEVKVRIPVEWVASLGTQITSNSYPVIGGKKLPYDITLPKDFVIVYSEGIGNEKYLIATSAYDSTIKMSKRENLSGGTLKFWSELAKRAIGEGNGFKIESSRQTTISGKKEAFRISAAKTINGKDYKYILVLCADDDYVYLFESWGTADAYARSAESVESSIKSIDLSSWF